MEAGEKEAILPGMEPNQLTDLEKPTLPELDQNLLAAIEQQSRSAGLEQNRFALGQNRAAEIAQPRVPVEQIREELVHNSRAVVMDQNRATFDPNRGLEQQHRMKLEAGVRAPLDPSRMYSTSIPTSAAMAATSVAQEIFFFDLVKSFLRPPQILYFRLSYTAHLLEWSSSK